jgi:hypothetical protein
MEVQKPEINNGFAVQQPDVLDAAIDNLNKAMGNPAPDDLNPAGRVAHWGHAVRALNIHSAHRAKVAAIVAQFHRDTVKLLGAMDYAGLKPVFAAFYKDVWYGGYTEGPREPSQDQLWRAHAKAEGWGDEEFERTVRWGTQGDAKIEDVNWELMKFTDGQIFKLRAVRLSLRSADSHISDDVWLQQFPPIRDLRIAVATPPMVIAGAVASGPAVVVSDRTVIDSTAGVKVD